MVEAVKARSRDTQPSECFKSGKSSPREVAFRLMFGECLGARRASGWWWWGGVRGWNQGVGHREENYIGKVLSIKVMVRT